MTKIFDLSSLGLPEGTHRVQVRAKAKGYANSDLSEAVSYTVAPVMYRLMRAIANKTFDLSTLGLAEGAHYVQVRARAKGFTDSELSESVIYVVEPIQPIEPIEPAEEDALLSLDGYALADANGVKLIAKGGT